MFTDMKQAADAVRDFAIDQPEACPDDIRTRVREYNPNDLVAIVEFAKTLYCAPRGLGSGNDIGPDLMRIGAGILNLIAMFRFFDIGHDGRALAMAKALLRDAGEPAGLVPWADPTTDPVIEKPV